ncbi:hypothetical protein V8D89_005578 [Ganoderma adspersum]
MSRAPLGPELDSLFESIPSPSPEPELEALVRSSTAQKPPKPDKGKKRTAATEDAPSASASKKAKLTASKAASKSTEKQPARPQGSGGRHPGSQNYTDPDLKMLLHLVADVLPIGGNGWARITDRFNKWAWDNNRPIRTQKPLKTKFDQMARTPKPTGCAEIPPLIARAQEIDHLISGEVHMRELNDSQVDIEEEEEEAELKEIEEEEEEFEIVEALAPSKKKKAATGGPVLKTFREQGSSGSSSTTRQSLASRRTQVNDFMSAVTSSLDPTHREARDKARFACRASQDEISHLTQDNRDLWNHYNSLNERFQQQAFAHQQAMGEVTRLQGRLDMLEMVGAFTVGTSILPPVPMLHLSLLVPISHQLLVHHLLAPDRVATARLTLEIMKEGGESIGGRKIGSMWSIKT